MKILPILLLLTLSTSFVLADAEYDALKGKYESAVKRAIEPLNKTYIEELKKLLEKQKKGGNFIDIEKTTTELTKLGASPSTALVANKKAEDEINKEFSGKKIKNASGTLLEFKKDGTGIKTTSQGQKLPFIWKVDGDVVVTTGSHLPGMPPANLYFRFKTKTEVIYGNTKEDLRFEATVTK